MATPPVTSPFSSLPQHLGLTPVTTRQRLRTPRTAFDSPLSGELSPIEDAGDDSDQPDMDVSERLAGSRVEWSPASLLTGDRVTSSAASDVLTAAHRCNVDELSTLARSLAVTRDDATTEKGVGVLLDSIETSPHFRERNGNRARPGGKRDTNALDFAEPNDAHVWDNDKTGDLSSVARNISDELSRSSLDEQ